MFSWYAMLCGLLYIDGVACARDRTRPHATAWDVASMTSVYRCVRERVGARDRMVWGKHDECVRAWACVWWV